MIVKIDGKEFESKIDEVYKSAYSTGYNDGVEAVRDTLRSIFAMDDDQLCAIIDLLSKKGFISGRKDIKKENEDD